jgi:hypothetical protein
MNDVTRKMLYFKECAAKFGCTYKVVGDHAYSSKPMCGGRYIKLISCKNNELLVYESPYKSLGLRYTYKIPDDFMPELKNKKGLSK